ncbi:hypothetical protein ZWY2020_052457 [Hordeum vulgare]|nr:hypothetical protein ZWY2020_052457 [Hordeum vulgare]
MEAEKVMEKVEMLAYIEEVEEEETELEPSYAAVYPAPSTEQDFGRVKDQQAHDKEVVKLKKEIDFLSNSYSQLVEDVSKLFDYQDGKMSHDMDYTSEAINKKKKELEDQARIEISMEKLKLAKEQRCILQSQADIIQNMRKAMKKVQVDRDLLKEEKKKLEYLIANLLDQVVEEMRLGCVNFGLDVLFLEMSSSELSSSLQNDIFNF